MFMGIDISVGGGIPMLFETMVFGGSMDGCTNRYATWDAAVSGHKKTIEEVAEADGLDIEQTRYDLLDVDDNEEHN